MSNPDWTKIVGNTGSNQYDQRITALKNNGIDSTSIEIAIQSTFRNLQNKVARSLVILVNRRAERRK